MMPSNTAAMSLVNRHEIDAELAGLKAGIEETWRRIPLA